MALDAAAVIRAGSGLLFVAVGAILAYAARERRRDVLPFALACASFGAGFVALNLLAGTAFLVGAVVEAVLFALAVVALAIHLRSARPALPRRIVVAALLAWAVSITIVADADASRTFFIAQGQLEASALASQVVFPAGAAVVTAFTLVASASARRHEASSDPRERRGLVLLSLGVLAFPASMTGFILGLAAADDAWVVSAAGVVFVVGLAVHAWLRTAPGVALAVLALTGFVQASFLYTGIAAIIGPVRIVAATLIAIALLRDGLAGRDLHLPTVRRGPVAAAALALLFIVAQVAQEFFAAQYGLLLGGIVAGAFLFAAQPIQRLIEGVATPRAHGSGGAQAAYRRAVRLALRDGAITRDEELDLAQLAHDLGLTAPDAVRLRHEVEREHGEEASGLAA